MLLAISITNTLIRAGIWENGVISQTVSLSASAPRTSDEYAALFDGAYRISGRDLSNCDGVIIGSVVPQLTSAVSEAVKRLTGHTAVIVGAGVRTGVDIRVEQHTQLGADIVANAAAALHICAPPLTVVDFGAATTLTVINRARELCGVVISAGLRLSADALSAHAAYLPYIDLTPPKSIIGRETAESMNAGALYGHAGMTDSIITLIAKELSEEQINVITTGEYATTLNAMLNFPHIYSPDLTLLGLASIYEIDLKKRRG